jgi:PD-(D/E)XK endonuclease
MIDRRRSGEADLSSDQKGAIAEAAIALAATRLGIDVYKALSDGTRADLVFDVGEQLLRVQCKWAPLHGDVVVVRCYSSRRTATGLKRTKYTNDEIDAIGAYCAALDRSFIVPASRCADRSQFDLRISPTRNSQRARINWVDDFALERLACGSSGAIAQLGERLRGTQEVAGSSPAGSIHSPTDV